MTTLTAVTIVHHDVPPSLNRIGSRGSHWAFSRAKARWSAELGWLLVASGLPRHLAFARATAELRFPTRRRRDADNFAWFLSKVLGDVLQPRWLDDDTPEFFRFGGVTFDPERGPARTRLTIEGRMSA